MKYIIREVVEIKLNSDNVNREEVSPRANHGSLSFEP
jgi:hypothetical protein